MVAVEGLLAGIVGVESDGYRTHRRDQHQFEIQHRPILLAWRGDPRHLVAPVCGFATIRGTASSACSWRVCACIQGVPALPENA